MYVKYLWRTLVNIVPPGHLKVGSSSGSFGQFPNVHSSGTPPLLTPSYGSWTEKRVVFHILVRASGILGRWRRGRCFCFSGAIRLQVGLSVRSNVKVIRFDVGLVIWY
jgi:hypothetical protein